MSTRLRIKLRIPWALPLTVATFLLFSKMYADVVVPTFNFGGMVSSPRDHRYIEMTLLIVTQFLLPGRVKMPSDFYNWLFFIVLLIPASVLSAEQGSARYSLFLMFAALWLSLAFRGFFGLVVSHRTYVSCNNYRKLPYYSIMCFVILILVLLAISVRGVFNLNFANVYEFRFHISANMPLALRYLLPMASGALVGYLAAMSAHRRDTKGMLLIAVIGVMFFGFSSHKAMLFYPLMVIFSYFYLKMSRPYLPIFICFLIMTLITLAIPSDNSRLLGALFANRVVFIPSHINFFYFDYFTKNSFMLWAESKISLGLVTSELPMAVMNYIGGLMTGNYEIGANTGWVANAYMNAGIIGIVIYAALVGFIFSLIDLWAKVYSLQLVGAAFLVPVTTMIMTADLLIVLLTSGLFVLLLIFQLTTMRLTMRNKNSVKKQKQAVCHNA